MDNFQINIWKLMEKKLYKMLTNKDYHVKRKQVGENSRKMKYEFLKTHY